MKGEEKLNQEFMIRHIHPDEYLITSAQQISQQHIYSLLLA